MKRRRRWIHDDRRFRDAIIRIDGWLEDPPPVSIDEGKDPAQETLDRIRSEIEPLYVEVRDARS